MIVVINYIYLKRQLKFSAGIFQKKALDSAVILIDIEGAEFSLLDSELFYFEDSDRWLIASGR